MSPAELIGSLELLGLTQMGAARLFKIDGRTVRRWTAGEKPVPEAVAIALRLMIKIERLRKALELIAEGEPNGRWAQTVAEGALVDRKA